MGIYEDIRATVEQLTGWTPPPPREVWVHPFTLARLREAAPPPSESLYGPHGHTLHGVPVYTDCRCWPGAVSDTARRGPHSCSAAAPCSAFTLEKGS